MVALAAGDPIRLGPYELIDRIGEGGQGVVFLGRGPTGEPVAVKLLHQRFVADPEARERFLREVALARRVARFCTAPVLYADLAGDRPYIVSEFVSGPSLRELVERTGPRRGAALERLAISTATALVAIHRAGITHRDFKPANVLMGPEGPVVIDFGVARALDSPQATATGTTIGTPSYLAPELLSGGTATPAADVFAWGVTMVFAATGRPAFGADTIPSVITRILTAEPDLGLLTDPLRDLVAACLAKDPALRPPAEEIVARLTGGPATPLPASTAPRTEDGRSKGPRRPRVPLLPLAVAAGMAVAAAGTATAISLSGNESQGGQAAARPTVRDETPGGETALSPVPDRPRLPSPTPSAGERPSPGASAVIAPTKRADPTTGPSRAPSARPSARASARASAKPSPLPSSRPDPPSPAPSQQPSPKPSPKPSAAPPSEPNPYTAAGVCGAGFKVIDSHSYGGAATTYLLYDAATGRNCVITLSKHEIPERIKMSAVLQVQGGGSAADSGSYTVYAGPLRLAAARKCVIWGGGYGSATWRSGWSHCG